MELLTPAVPSEAARRPTRPPSGVAPASTWFFLFALILLLAVSAKLLQDPDSLWHIAVGRWIWQTRAVPRTDPFSYTFAGAPWTAKEWLAQILFYGAYAAARWSGVVVLTATAAAATFALLFDWLGQRVRWTAALATTLVAFLIAAGSLNARPQVFGFLALVIWTRTLVDAVERRTAPPWRALLVLVAWVNLHSSFPVGLAIAGLLALDAVRATGPAARRRTATQWAAFLAAAGLAAGVSPYGYRALLVSTAVVGSGESLPYIGEWRPLALDGPGLVAIGTLVGLTLALARRPRENALRLLGIVLFGYLMVRHTRFAVLFALVAPLLAAGPVVRQFPCLAPSAADPAPQFPRPAVARLAHAALAFAALGLAFVVSPRPDPRIAPDQALSTARARGITGPVYNDYDFGGFLISRGVRTFIDGRTDQLFLGGFITTVMRAEARADHGPFAALLDRHHVTWALVRPKSDAARHLAAIPGWRAVYADPVAAVYSRE